MGRLLPRVVKLKSKLALLHQDVAGDAHVNYASITSGLKSPPKNLDAVVEDPSVETTLVGHERCFSRIIRGIIESPKGTLKVDRQKHKNLDEIMSLISSLDLQIELNVVRYHVQLGRYNSKSRQPRQIYRFTKTFEVSSIMSMCRNVHTPLSVRPDLYITPGKTGMKQAVSNHQTGSRHTEVGVKSDANLPRLKAC